MPANIPTSDVFLSLMDDIPQGRSSISFISLLASCPQAPSMSCPISWRIVVRMPNSSRKHFWNATILPAEGAAKVSSPVGKAGLYGMRLTVTCMSCKRIPRLLASSMLSLTPFRRMYSTKMERCRAYCRYWWTASINLCRGKAFALGTISSLFSCEGACSESAR